MNRQAKDAPAVSTAYPFNEIEDIIGDFKAFVEGVQNASIGDKDTVRLEMDMTDFSCDRALRLADLYLMMKKTFCNQ